MIDLVQIRVISGSGGKGAVSFRREKFVPRGGPDGGDGGRGGDVVLIADPGLTTLAHLRFKHLYKAKDGGAGAKRQRHGANGESLVVRVPAGTVVSVEGDEESWDLDQPGMQVIAARGGDGGRGNARFANSVRQAPNFAEKGLPGEDKMLKLELKLLADAGIVGLPNAGKSTLLRSVSRATPEVADFPFTTLEPVLGVVELGMEAFVMADLPGLIEGAHEGTGLGHQFLRHVERTRVLVHLLDAGAEDPVKDHAVIRRELALYDPRLVEKPEIVVLNKIDLPEARAHAERLRDAFGEGREALLISGATGEGVAALVQRLQRLLQETAPKIETKPATLPVLRPRAQERIEVERIDSVFVVHGQRAQEEALKLGAGGPEALDELQARLRRLGLERALRRAGARPGDRLRVGEVELEWQG